MAGLTGSALAIGGLDAKNKGNSKGKGKSKSKGKGKSKANGTGVKDKGGAGRTPSLRSQVFASCSPVPVSNSDPNPRLCADGQRAEGADLPNSGEGSVTLQSDDCTCTVTFQIAERAGGNEPGSLTGFTSNCPITRVVIKASTVADVYDFGGCKEWSGTLTPSTGAGISHIDFCFNCATCVPRTCADYGPDACGTALDDGCNGTIDCGCNDGDKCTENTCSATAAGEVGTCSFPAKDCAKTNGVDQCNEGYCDPEDGQCKTRPVTDGQECNDGLYCTVNETCQAGQCVGQPRDCSAEDDQCNRGVCDEANDTCVKQPTPGVACDDSLYCTVDDTCDANGACVGAPRDCSEAGDQCNDGVCDESLDACVKKYKSGTCNDAVNCTENDICIEQTDGSGACQGTPKVCNDGRICTNDYCREADGQCVYEPDNSKCDDQILCTVDVCDPVNGDSTTGCTHTPTDSLCPAKDHCRPGICDPANGDANGCSYDCFDGCTPGYWKNHPAAWIGYSTTQSVSTVFATDCATEGSATLLQALNFGGNNTRCGGAQILLRAAVAALLNLSAGLDYEGAPSGIATVAELQTAVNAALAGTRQQMIALARSLDYWNNAGCPCNQICVGR